MYQNITRLFSIVALMPVLTACGVLFDAAFDRTVTYNSIKGEMSQGQTIDEMEDLLTDNPTLPGTPDPISTLPDNPVDVTVELDHRCAVGELDAIKLVLACRPNEKVIFTLKDISGEKKLYEIPTIEALADLRKLQRGTQSLLSATYKGSSFDIFICIDHNNNQKCSDEQIYDFDDFNDILVGNRPVANGTFKNDKNTTACDHELMGSVTKGMVIYHRNINQKVEASQFTKSEVLKHNVEGAVGNYLKNIKEYDDVQRDEDGTLVRIKLAEALGEQCGGVGPRVSGCFVKGTEIRISPRVKVPIENLREGDPILLANGKLSKVKQVIKGPESKPVLRFTLEGGESVTVTEYHPMWTDSGLALAKEVSLSARMQNRQGQWKSIKSIAAEVYKDDVYNVRLEGPSNQEHLLIANEIVTGDLELQEKMAPAVKMPQQQLAKGK